MIQTFVIAMFASLWLFSPENTFAQTANAQQKTQELVASLSKTKYKHKVKKNFEVEIYIDIKSEAVVKNNVEEYSGNYESENSNHQIKLNITNGKIEGSGYDADFGSSKKASFSLKDAKIEGALLTATKVYENGKTENFEAVFVNRTVVQGKNPNKIEHRETAFGLGFVNTNEAYMERIFSQYKP
jgi:hypothetical protein